MSASDVDLYQRRVKADVIRLNSSIDDGDYSEALGWAEDCVTLIRRLREAEERQSQEVAP